MMVFTAFWILHFIGELFNPHRFPGPLATFFNLLLLSLPLVVFGLATRAVIAASKYGSFKGAIKEEVVGRGDEFHFRLEQEFHFKTDVKMVRVFLIYRVDIEMHPTYSGETKHIEKRIYDRLLDESTQQGGLFGAHKPLTQIHKLKIPNRLFSNDHPFRFKRPKSTSSCWIIKIRFDMASGDVGWREYQLVTDQTAPEQADKPEDHTLRHPNLEQPTFDLLCTNSPKYYWLWEQKIWETAVPHGLWGFNAKRPEAPAFFVLQSRSRAEVEAVKAKLERTSASFEIRERVPC